MSVCPRDDPCSSSGPAGGWLSIQGPVFMEREGESVCVLGISISSLCPPAQLPPELSAGPPEEQGCGAEGIC